MTDAERREASRQFYIKWNNKGKEDEDDRSYWLDILQRILGIKNATDKIEFQKKVIVDGNTKRIDAYISETKIIIEQKSLGIDLEKIIRQSGDVFLTPYEQAKRYNDNLPLSEKARWIITSNFAEIWIYDMDTKIPEASVVKINISDLQNKYSLLDFLYNEERKKITEETEISIKAGELVGDLYQSLVGQYKNIEDDEAEARSLNILCVRLVFCFYAEDSGLFGDRDAFTNFIKRYDVSVLRDRLIKLFSVLDTPEDKRDPYLSDDLKAFPYCNGGLFANEEIIIPQITDEIKDTLIQTGAFDWRGISPTIFGAVFESTLNPETRRSGGMHYTSIENIHKVIDPLFLDELKDEAETLFKETNLNKKKQNLETYQEKIASLTFLDPACGSGNFLTETYISLRRLENKVISEIAACEKGAIRGQIDFGLEGINPIKVNINQFYGIEINDFAVTVAKTALWIAESQMMQETEDVLHMNLDFLPLKTNATIVEGNALRIDWNDVLPSTKCNYIMGNPPFVGARLMSKKQKEDVSKILGHLKGSGNLDYVSCWYEKAKEYMRGTVIKAALVSTNSICQGEQVAILWKEIFSAGIFINFAHRTFRWDSEASIKAHVHCVIVGFSYKEQKEKNIYDGDKIISADKINGYLYNAPVVFVESSSKPICNVNKMDFGSMPNDGGYLSNYSKDDMEAICKKYPDARKYFRRIYGADEFINNKERYCIWLDKVAPNEYKNITPFIDAIKKVREMRLASKRESTKKLAECPYLFGEIRQPDTNYLLVPSTSSERRRYVPIGFIDKRIISSNANLVVSGATLYDFGILTSNVHMAWMRAVAGRLKSDYRYSAKIVYNNFPWPTPTDEQKAKIEETAQGILDARALYPDSSLADLYDPLTMPPELQKAHHLNDAAVMRAYGFDVKSTSEPDCVAKLMEMYSELTKK